MVLRNGYKEIKNGIQRKIENPEKFWITEAKKVIFIKDVQIIKAEILECLANSLLLTEYETLSYATHWGDPQCGSTSMEGWTKIEKGNKQEKSFTITSGQSWVHETFHTLPGQA